MTPSQRAERVNKAFEKQRQDRIKAQKMSILNAIKLNGQLTTAEVVTACRFANNRSASAVLLQLRKECRVARRESGEWVLTGR